MNELKQLKDTKYEIKSNEDVLRLNVILRRTIELEKKICDRIDPEIANAYKTHKGLTALKKEELQPLLNVKNLINEALKQWQIKKDAEAKALQDKINADLARQVEEQKAKLLSNATDEWSQEVAKDKIAEIVVQTVELKECQKAVEVKQEGQYRRSNWKCRVNDFDLVPREYLILNESLVLKLAREQKEAFNIPGLESFDDFTIVTKV